MTRAATQRRGRPPSPSLDDAATRTTGDRGASTVAAIAIMFSITFLALVWLARDVDRARSNEGAAEAIAFQAARSGAQAASIGSLRTGDIVIDADAAAVAASDAAHTLFRSYEVDGAITGIQVDERDRRVRVDVRITDGQVTVHGVGIVTIEEAP